MKDWLEGYGMAEVRVSVRLVQSESRVESSSFAV